MICALIFIISSHLGIKCLWNLLQLEQCNIMFIVISDIMVHRYEMWSTIVFANSFCTGKKFFCALMFIISNHHGIKCLSNLQQLEPCIVIFKRISYTMVHLYDLWNTIRIAIHFYNGKKKWFVHCCLSSAIIME